VIQYANEQSSEHKTLSTTTEFAASEIHTTKIISVLTVYVTVFYTRLYVNIYLTNLTDVERVSVFWDAIPCGFMHRFQNFRRKRVPPTYTQRTKQTFHPKFGILKIYLECEWPESLRLSLATGVNITWPRNLQQITQTISHTSAVLSLSLFSHHISITVTCVFLKNVL